jgi:tetratricopeptide (TPR) repeat protein
MNLIKKIIGREKAPEYQILYTQGLLDLTLFKKPNDAIEKFKMALQLKPDYLDARLSLGDAYLGTEQWDLAVDQFQAAVAISSKNSDAHLGLAKAYLAQGKFDDFFREGELALKVSGQSADAFTDLVSMASKAQSHREKLVAATLYLAMLLNARGSWAELQGICEGLLEADVDHTTERFLLGVAHFLLGIAHFHQGRLDKAQIELRRASEFGSIYAHEHPLLGNCDLCGAPLQAGTKLYSAIEIKNAVRSGLRPPATAVELGAALGMSQSLTESNWIQKVMTDSSDWLLCSTCSTTFARFLPSK